MARAIGDLLLAALVVAGAIALFVGAAALPPPRFEPLGSAALPRILGTILIVLALMVALRAVLRLRGAQPRANTESGEARPILGVLVFVALVAYVAALDFGRAPFVPATGVFLGAVGLILSGGSARACGVYAVLGLGLGSALAFVFSRFLYISIG